LTWPWRAISLPSVATLTVGHNMNRIYSIVPSVAAVACAAAPLVASNPLESRALTSTLFAARRREVSPDGKHVGTHHSSDGGADSFGTWIRDSQPGISRGSAGSTGASEPTVVARRAVDRVHGAGGRRSGRARSAQHGTGIRFIAW